MKGRFISKEPPGSAVTRGIAKPKLQRVVVGIDFGTTYSGLAWTISSRTDRIDVLTDWKAADYKNNDKQKAPTVLQYNTPGKQPEWGYNITAEDATLKWFKLLLLDNDDIPLYLRNCGNLSQTRQLLREADKTPIEAIADYLRLLWQHALDTFERALGKTMLNSCMFQFVATLPAIWPHYAQVRMREALELSGILATKSQLEPTLNFISEPEAAALATMQDLIDRVEVKKGDNFVVCDAGGGTVDIITYEIVKTNPMTVRESVKGDGDLCGAVLLDDAFLNTLRELLPRATWDNLGAKGIRRLIHDHWENGIKGAFTNSNAAWNIPIPYGGTVEDGFRSPNQDIKSSQILQIFRPVVAKIEALVASQIAEVKQQHGKLPKYVVVVGGFGKSSYLHERLEATVGKKIEVIHGFGERPWTAVCRGAVIKGLTDTKLTDSIAVVDSRIVRASYGTLFNAVPFELAEHDPADMVYCDIQQTFLAADQTKWFLEIGDKLSADESICTDFWQGVEGPDDGIDIELVVSDARTPPKRKESTVRSLCNIRLSKLPDFDKLPVWKNTEGKEYCRFHYELRIVCTGASLDVGVYHKERRLESCNVAVEFNSGKASSWFDRRVPDALQL